MDKDSIEWMIVGGVILFAMVYTFWPGGSDDE